MSDVQLQGLGANEAEMQIVGVDLHAGADDRDAGKADCFPGTGSQMFSYCIAGLLESQAGLGGTNAGGFARRASTTEEGTGIHNDGGDHAGAGNRSNHGDFYARAPSDAEVPAGIEAR
jgi:hypothetical protein